MKFHKVHFEHRDGMKYLESPLGGWGGFLSEDIFN